MLSAGFKELGDKGRILQNELEVAIRQSGVRAVGRNCQGVMCPGHAVYCGFGTPLQHKHGQRGKVALVTLSRGFAYAVMTLAQENGIDFSCVVSTGNETDFDAVSLLDYLLEQDDVETLAVCPEGMRDRRAMRRSGQRVLHRRKPILVWKVGDSKLGRRAAALHTAKLNAPCELYVEAIREGGLMELREVDNLIDAVRAFCARHVRALGPGCLMRHETMRSGHGS